MTTYRLLGRTGLRVSPLALGTMTFGTEYAWGIEQQTAFTLMDRFVERGGNFLDTADGYTNGTSEKIIGAWMEARGNRERIVLATKYSQTFSKGEPNSAGNGRKHLYDALHGSLRRLKTDHVDVYWVHAWDGLTPVEEVMSTLNDLVRAGKIRAIGLSDVPAWYLARAQTMAEWRGWERVAAMQLEYSLVERNIEREHVVAAKELGIGLVPWSPLASGMLSGKHTRESVKQQGKDRITQMASSGIPAFEKLYTEKNWAIVDRLLEVSKQLGKSPAQVALNWVTNRPTVCSTLIGATKLSQLDNNLSALDFEIPENQRRALEEIGEPEVVHPYHFFQSPMSGFTTAQQHIERVVF